jgi:speckle-type POZ protein
MSASTSAGGGKPSNSSSSAIVAGTTSGYHILKIDGYSGTKGTPWGKCHQSHTFTVGGHQWFIRYYPNGCIWVPKDYISFFLVLNQCVAKEVKMQYRIRFADQAEETPLLSEEVITFSNNYTDWRYADFIKREDLEKSEHLKDDSFAVRCDIIITNNVYAKEIAEATMPAFVSVPPSDLGAHLGDLLLSENGADVVFEVGSQTFAAHRCVMAARSPVFKAELLGAMKESVTTGVVRIDNMEARVFKALLYFMYTDSLPEVKKEEEEDDVMSQHLLVAADKYNLERLKLICEDKLCKYIDVGTVATILTLAEQHHCHGLKKVCFDFLSSPTNLRAVVATDGFKHLSRSCPAIMEELIAHAWKFGSVILILSVLAMVVEVLWTSIIR